MQEEYKILGLTEDATDEEIENAYTALKNKYSRERFLEGEAGNEAAKNLTKLENAYQEIKDGKKNKSAYNSSFSYEEIYNTLKKGDYNTAQQQLDKVSYRGAEWHYLQSVVFYKKNWINESKKQLEIAIELDPDNQKYKSEYEKLKNSMNMHGDNFNNNRGYGTYNQNGQTQNVNYNQQQMGRNGAMDFCECCTTWCCMNMLCNSFCR
ncbi:MAG: hypothetical protein IJR66_01315 [Clostridia bacterium]|nr:hypothetical protein [Clostridia bacterium]